MIYCFTSNSEIYFSWGIYKYKAFYIVVMILLLRDVTKSGYSGRDLSL